MSQAITIIFAGITPILILVPNIPARIQAIPPIIASMTASLAVFRWHENWIRCKNSEEDLEFEKLKFIVRATKFYRGLTEDEAISNFIDTVNTIHKSHLQEWTKSRFEEIKKEEIRKTENEELEYEESMVREALLGQQIKKLQEEVSNLADLVNTRLLVKDVNHKKINEISDLKDLQESYQEEK